MRRRKMSRNENVDLNEILKTRVAIQCAGRDYVHASLSTIANEFLNDFSSYFILITFSFFRFSFKLISLLCFLNYYYFFDDFDDLI